MKGVREAVYICILFNTSISSVFDRFFQVCRACRTNGNL